MISKFRNLIYNYLSNIEQNISWNMVYSIYQPLIILFIILKVSIFIFGFFLTIPLNIITLSQTVTNIIYIAISLYCIIKFGPWSKSKFNKNDSEIIYRAGLLLFGSSLLGELIKSNTKIIQDEINKSFNK